MSSDVQHTKSHCPPPKHALLSQRAGSPVSPPSHCPLSILPLNVLVPNKSLHLTDFYLRHFFFQQTSDSPSPTLFPPCLFCIKKFLVSVVQFISKEKQTNKPRTALPDISKKQGYCTVNCSLIRAEGEEPAFNNPDETPAAAAAALLCCMKRKPGGHTRAACVCSHKAVIPALNSTKAGPASATSPSVRGDKQKRERESNTFPKRKEKIFLVAVFTVLLLFFHKR